MEDCRNCTGGDYCNTTAMSSTSGPCQPGYYCPEGSSNSEQMLCPEGSYCELGTFHPESCRTGTFSNNTMLKSLSDCTLCSPGSYCESTRLTRPSGKCQAAYYCPRGSSNKTAYECPIGTHCPEGSGSYKYCPAGTYTDYSGASTCHVCPQRYFCVPEKVSPGMKGSYSKKCCS